MKQPLLYVVAFLVALSSVQASPNNETNDEPSIDIIECNDILTYGSPSHLSETLNNLSQDKRAVNETLISQLEILLNKNYLSKKALLRVLEADETDTKNVLQLLITNNELLTQTSPLKATQLHTVYNILNQFFNDHHTQVDIAVLKAWALKHFDQHQSEESEQPFVYKKTIIIEQHAKLIQDTLNSKSMDITAKGQKLKVIDPNSLSDQELSFVLNVFKSNIGSNTITFALINLQLTELFEAFYTRLGIDINEKNIHGNTALIHLISNQNLKDTNYLLQFPDIKVNEKDNENWTALMVAARFGNIQITKTLLSRTDIFINSAGEHDPTLLEDAISASPHLINIHPLIQWRLNHPNASANELRRHYRVPFIRRCINELRYRFVTLCNNED